MSFGAAASARRGRRLAADAPCPCGRRDFASCCGPVLDGRAAETPEDLMRSRYTAFALGDARHLVDTWFPGTRPGDLTIDPDTEWMRLDIQGSDIAPDGRSGRVRFRASWREGAGGDLETMEEHSRFIRRAGRWYYVDAL